MCPSHWLLTLRRQLLLRSMLRLQSPSMRMSAIRRLRLRQLLWSPQSLLRRLLPRMLKLQLFLLPSSRSPWWSHRERRRALRRRLQQ